jgi:DNA-binding IclR family transcriptional regulator
MNYWFDRRTKQLNLRIRSQTMTEPNYTVESVDAAIALLEIVAAEPDLGLSEIARRAGLGKARVFRLMKTLEGRGLLTCAEPARTYRLGYMMLTLGGAATVQINLVNIARPVLAELGAKAEETAQVRVLDGQQSVCVAIWEPNRSIKVSARLGRRRPLYVGSSKILLAYSDPAFRESVIKGPLDAMKKKTRASAGELRKRLARIRADGYDVSRGEVSDDLISISAPVFGPGGKLHAAINISAPDNRISKAMVKKTITEVVDAAKKLSGMLGYQGTWPASVD